MYSKLLFNYKYQYYLPKACEYYITQIKSKIQTTKQKKAKGKRMHR